MPQMRRKRRARMTYAPGQRVIFRESEDGEPEPGIVVEELPPTESHPNGGEYDLLLDDESGVIAWVAELEAA